MIESADSAGLSRPLLTFLAVLIAGQAVLMGIGYAFPDLNLPSVVGIVITMVAAMTGGQSFARENQRQMTRAEQMRFALIGTVISVGLVVAVLAGMFAYYGVPFSMDNLAIALTGDLQMATDLKNWLWLILAIGVLLTFCIVYFGVGSGAKGVIRAMEKQAAKGR